MILAQRTPLPPPLVAGEIVQASWGFAVGVGCAARTTCRDALPNVWSSVGLWAFRTQARMAFCCVSMAARQFCLLAYACRGVWLLLLRVRWVLGDDYM